MKKSILLSLILLLLLSCSHDDETQSTTYTLSGDICQACKTPSYYVPGTDTILVSSIITPNTDGLNDKLKITWRKNEI